MITAKDNYTAAITKMRNTQTAFRKDVKELDKELKALNNNKVQLKVDMQQASNALKDAKKQFAELGDEAARLKLIDAQTNFDNVKSNLDLVSKAAKQAEKDMASLSDTSSKIDARAGGSGADAGGGGTISQLAGAGLFSQLGSAAGGLGNALLTSAFGSSAGQTIGDTISGAVSGAAIGSIVPGIGTAIGAVIGGVGGLIGGLTKEFEKEEDAFKEVVRNTFDEVTTEQVARAQTGSEIAARREMDMMSFATLLGGQENADKYMADLIDFAATTPFSYEGLTGLSKTLLTYGYGQDELLEKLGIVGGAGAALGLSEESMSDIAKYIGRMNSTGKTTMEYLNPLLERGIPVMDYLLDGIRKLDAATGQYLEVTNAELQDMIRRGEVDGVAAAELIFKGLNKNFGEALENSSSTFTMLTSNLEDLKEGIDAAVGEGFNEARKVGLEKEIAWYTENQEALKEANRAMGAFQAEQVNAQNQAEIDALASMLEKKEVLDNIYAVFDSMKSPFGSMESLFGSPKDSLQYNAEVGRMMAEAQAQATADYIDSEAYQTQLDAQLALVDKIQAALVPVYQDMGYSFAQATSTGTADAWSKVESMPTSTPKMPDLIPSGHAYGLNRVPYDNFPTLLHEGERVLTAAEARRQDSNSTSVTISGNSFTVREEADISAIASELAQQIKSAQLSYTG